MPPFFRDKIRPKCHAFRSKTYMYFCTYIPELLPYLPGSHIPDNTFPKTSGSAEQSLPNPTHKTITVSFAINLIITS